MIEDKISKFVRTDEISDKIESLISNKNKDKSRSSFTSVFDPAHLTECHRRLIYRSHCYLPDNPSQYLGSMDEMFTRKKWIEYLSTCQSIRILDKNITTADCHYNVSGNADAILNMEGTNYVVKIQPVSEKDFDQIKKKGAFKKHVVELIVYIWLTELKDGILLYENKDTDEYKVFHIKYYDPIIKSITKKCIDLIEDKLQGKIPERPYKSIESSECSVCEFKEKCWREKL